MPIFQIFSAKRMTCEKWGTPFVVTGYGHSGLESSVTITTLPWILQFVALPSTFRLGDEPESLEPRVVRVVGRDSM